MSLRNLTSIGDLKKDPRNPRKHGERNLQQIEQSLKNFGAGRSIVIDEKNHILAGNGLVEAAGNIGLSKLVVVDATGEEIVAVRRRGLTDKQKSEYRIADNRSAELAEWDAETLAAMAEEIDREQFWTDEELEFLLAQEPEQTVVDAEPQIDRAA